MLSFFDAGILDDGSCSMTETIKIMTIGLLVRTFKGVFKDGKYCDYEDYCRGKIVKFNP